MTALGENELDSRYPGEADLTARARAGDADAFGQLYELHVDRVYRYVAYRVKTEHEAEDLTEQVFLKAWEAMPRYEDRGLPFRAWLFRLAHNLVIDHYRVRRSDVSLNELLDSDQSYEPSGPDPQVEVEARLDADEVRLAVRRLGEEQRQVVLLRFVEGLSHSEVADILGKTEGATRAIQHRALGALARALKLTRGTDEAKRESARRGHRGPRPRLVNGGVSGQVARVPGGS
jgi:RNA polymerase sigma-70 factor (ECF subfamily)